MADRIWKLELDGAGPRAGSGKRDDRADGIPVRWYS